MKTFGQSHLWMSLVCFTILLSSCGDNATQPRHYVEITIPAPSEENQQLTLPSWHPPIGDMSSSDMNNPELAKLVQDSTLNIPLTWETPKTWNEEQGSGMRLVTFRSHETDPIECSIVSLSGAAGGVEANLRRWMQQIGLNVSDQEFVRFLQNPSTLKTKNKEEASVFDFTQLQKSDSDQSPSMMAIVFSINETTIFVKMTGSKKAVLKNRTPFISLGGSLQIDE